MHRIVALAVAACASFALPAGASAQSYPERSVKFIVAFPAGSTIDTPREAPR